MTDTPLPADLDWMPSPVGGTDFAFTEDGRKFVRLRSFRSIPEYVFEDVAARRHGTD